MTRLSFELNFKTDELNTLGLPIEIRQPDMSLVKRTLASESVEVPPGTYYVSFKMPAGQEAWSRVELSEGQDKTIQLNPNPEDKPPPDLPEVQYYFSVSDILQTQKESAAISIVANGLTGAILGAAIGAGTNQLTTTVDSNIVGGIVGAIVGAAVSIGSSRFGSSSLPSAPWTQALQRGVSSIKRRIADARLRKFSGNVLAGDCSSDDEWTPVSPEATGEVTKIVVGGDNRNQILQLIQAGEPAVNMVLPTWAENSCQVFLTKLPDGKYSMEVYLQNTSADLLLRYWEQGLWQLAAGVANSTAISAEELLNQKQRHPISAAVGAYALLRIGELERLHDWTENLKNWFDWLPDGVAIRGEHLARLGKHEEALRIFCELPERGLPYFSDGLSYTVDRLRLYLSFGEKHFKTEDLKCAASVLDLLEPFVRFADFGKSLLTYTGLDPAKPDAEPIGKKLSSYGGLDLSKTAAWSKKILSKSS